MSFEKLLPLNSKRREFAKKKKKKLNIDSKNKINTKNYLKNGESGGYHTDRNWRLR